MRNCTGSTSQNVSTTHWGVTVHRCLQCKAPDSGVPCQLLYTSLRHSQPTSFTVSHSTSPDRTVPRYRLSTFGCRAFSVAGPTVWNSLRYRTVFATRRSQQQLQTIAENEPISSLPLSTHSAVEMLHDCALYKSTIDI